MSESLRYSVVQAGDVSEEFKRLAFQARAEGRLPIFLAATKWAMEELARTPHEFGESWYIYPRSQLVFRRGFARPLYIQYAIHDAERVVFLRQFALLRGT